MLLASVATMVATTTANVASSAADVSASVGATAAIESMVTSVVAAVLPSSATTTAPVTETALFLPVGFEVLAIFAGGLAGGMTGVRRGFDIPGVFSLAIVAGLGGGIIRDVLLQDYGIFALDNPRALAGALIGATVAMFFLKAADTLRSLLLIVDALSLSLFCLVGADKALVAGLTPLSAVLLGTVTAVGGGILRDIMCNVEPEVLRRGSLYGSAAIVGSTLYVTMAGFGITKPLSMLLAAIVALVLRMGSIWFGWESPEPVDLTDHLVRVPRSAFNAGRSLLRARTRQDALDSHDEPPAGE